MEGAGQKWGVGNKLKLEGQGLPEVLLDLLLGSEVERAIRTRDL